MSTLERAMGLLQELPERKLEAVYMYMRFVNSQTDDADLIPPKNKDVNSIAGIAHEYASPGLMEKDTTALENAAVEKLTEKDSMEKRKKGFQGLMSFAGTLPEDFDYKKELEGQERKNMLVLFDTNILLDIYFKHAQGTVHKLLMHSSLTAGLYNGVYWKFTAPKGWNTPKASRPPHGRPPALPG